MNDAKRQAVGFLSSLFDFSFRSFVTGKVVAFLYGIALLGIGLFTLTLIAGAFSRSAFAGIFMLAVGGPTIFLIGATYARLTLELAIVLFRIAENTERMAEATFRGLHLESQTKEGPAG